MRTHLVVASALVCVLGVAGCGDHTDTVPLPTGPIEQLPINATVQAPGLGGTTDVVFDEHGMPHVFAPDIASALFVQGYLTASARFWEMDAFRRLAEGRLSELLGRAGVNQDIAMRTVFTTRDGRRLEEALWEYVQAVDPELARSGAGLHRRRQRLAHRSARRPQRRDAAAGVSALPGDRRDARDAGGLAAAGHAGHRPLAGLRAVGNARRRDRSRAQIMQVACRVPWSQDVFRSAPAAPDHRAAGGGAAPRDARRRRGDTSRRCRRSTC